ncbi:GNAT family N-acetyltransferase [Nitrospirillum pindoramense]|uniref:N-acetylglutamate synthase-like GNAT family acetyltransferase n=1 Tax=Nitrospirillum amazonense TaxID=28077 RepID=A0A560HDK3_9PROT|nr:GNAT family N-acetyltransferase [Nitrospirillum amazonense]TWB44462.1 N-acetylglutamate synthase-like GNAT family acetyltransferase [Nitrospirillum amazonense]
MDIRPYRAGDESDIAALIVPIQQGEFGIPISYEDQPDLRDIPGFYLMGAGQFWVAVEGDAIVGSIALKDIGGGAGALRKMFVAPSHRGVPHRAAVRLLAVLLAHAKEVGLTSLYLGTTAKFLAAHRFYEKSGFSQITPDELPPTFPRMAVDTRFYFLSL